MEKVTVTKRARYEEIIDLAALAQENGFEGFDLTGMIEFAQKEISALDVKAAKAKERAAEKRAEGDVLTDVVLSVLTDEATAIADITALVAAVEGYEDVTVGKVQYRLGALAREGKAVKSDIVVPATETSKRRVISGYAKA